MSEAVAEDTLAALRALDVAEVSDALDRLGIPGQVPGIYGIEPTFTLAGPATTLRYGPVDDDGGTVGDFIDDVPAGNVIVIDNQGRRDATVWGDILTTVAARNRLGGTVIDGVCRDAAAAVACDYPIFSAGVWMRTGKDRVRLEAIDVPVSLSGVRVASGDVIVGGRDGVVAVPRAALDDVIEIAQGIARAERGILDAVRSGRRLDDARRGHGYHALQSRER